MGLTLEIIGAFLVWTTLIVGAFWQLIRYIDRKYSHLHMRLNEFKDHVDDKYARRDDLAQIVGRIEGRMESFSTIMQTGFARLDQRIDDFFSKK